MSDEIFESDVVTAAEEQVIHIVDELSEAQRERDEYRDALQHLQADFENYRKRVLKSSEDAAYSLCGRRCCEVATSARRI